MSATIVRDLLATHETIAVFKGIEHRPCLFKTSLCPNECGHAQDWANFDIQRVIKYEKPGQYGDDLATKFHYSMKETQLDSKDEPDHAKEQKAFRDIIISQLTAGDNVLLSWRHDYVHRSNVVDGQEYKSSSPERPITKLEKISAQDADKI